MPATDDAPSAEDPEGPWTSADAWILAATPSRGRGNSLTWLIAGADAINHDIPTRDQLASALGALVQAGLVEEHEGKFRTTRDGKAIKKHLKGMFTWHETLLPLLQQLQRADVEWPLTDEEFEAAYTAYLDRHS